MPTAQPGSERSRRRPVAGAPNPGRPSPVDAPPGPGAARPRARHRRGCAGGRAADRRRRDGAARRRSPATVTTSPGRTGRSPGREVHQPAVAGATGHAPGRRVLAALARGDQHLHRAPLECPVLLPRRSPPAARRAARSAPARRPWAPGRAAWPPGVPGRGEYWKVNAEANRAFATTSSVAAKSSSVSPGNPTMMSVEIAASGIAARTSSRIARNRADRYERRIAAQDRGPTRTAAACAAAGTRSGSAPSPR